METLETLNQTIEQLKKESAELISKYQKTNERIEKLNSQRDELLDAQALETIKENIKVDDYFKYVKQDKWYYDPLVIYKVDKIDLELEEVVLICYTVCDYNHNYHTDVEVRVFAHPKDVIEILEHSEAISEEEFENLLPIFLKPTLVENLNR